MSGAEELRLTLFFRAELEFISNGDDERRVLGFEYKVSSGPKNLWQTYVERYTAEPCLKPN